MKKDYLSSFIDDEYNIPEIALKTIFLSPIIMSFFFFLLITFSFTRRFGFWLLDENKPVEILTFLMFFIGGIYGFYKTYRLKQILKFKFSFFYVMFSFFLILIAMEEISWGQWFLHFNTPINWEKINMQGETTLHNLKGMQGNSELLRILFGIGG